MSALRRFPVILGLTFLTIHLCHAEDEPKKTVRLKCLSPDKRFVLRLSPPTSDDDYNYHAELIEQASGKVLTVLSVVHPGHLVETVLVWSADSKRVAFGTRDNKAGETSVYFWNGSTFDEIELPESLPTPDIRFAKGAGENVKNYGGATFPVRWLKSGDLELASEFMMLSRVDEHSYTGTIHFTIAFDKQHHAKLHTTGKTRTHVDE